MPALVLVIFGHRILHLEDGEIPRHPLISALLRPRPAQPPSPRGESCSATSPSCDEELADIDPGEGGLLGLLLCRSAGRAPGGAAPGDDHGPGRQVPAGNQHQKNPENTPGGTAHPATAKLDVLQEDGKALLVKEPHVLLITSQILHNH